MATTDDGSNSMSDSAASEDLSKPTAPARPSRLPPMLPVGVMIALIALAIGLAATFLTARLLNASRMAVAPATAAKTPPALIAPPAIQAPEAPKGEAIADPDLAKVEVEKLQGYWVMAALEIDGVSVGAERIKSATLEVRGDRYLAKSGKAMREVRFKLDPSKKPKEIDLFFPDPPNADKVHRGIYSIEGDTFKLCKAQAADRPRPTEFVTRADTGNFVVTWKRPPMK
jgi:uncharacterized protein (TIGR03067 family)